MGVPLFAEPLRCSDAEAQLGLLADGELQDELELTELRGHIAGCPSCESAWRRLQDGKRALQAAAFARTEDELCPPAVLAAIDDVIAADVRRSAVGLIARVGAVVVLAVAVAFALWSLRIG
ncbi:MAG: zf-HC2 domain-containing protein [Deltaproteobacteria bacterium]|nr:zf-HC2 domain-containing protein [Deltaproteobacteria bacterium]